MAVTEEERKRPYDGVSENTIHIGSCSGRNKVRRLLFMAEQLRTFDSPCMAAHCLREAYEEAKKGEDTRLFKRVVELIDGSVDPEYALGPDYAMDTAWCDALDARARHRKDFLLARLNHALTDDASKGDVRTAYNDLGDFYLARGELQGALDCYFHARDHCFTPSHLVDSYMRPIPVAIEMRQYTLNNGLVSQALQLPDGLDPVTLSKLQCAAGLAHLAVKEYKLAAAMFLEVDPELGTSYAEVIAPQDVATCGILCSLATYDRTELKEKVVMNLRFWGLCKLIPEMDVILLDFDDGVLDPNCYASSWFALENVKRSLLQDIYLHDHMETLSSQIRRKVLIYFTLSSHTIDLRSMAFLFCTSVSSLEKELEVFIANNEIQATIDSNLKLLQHQHAEN